MKALAFTPSSLFQMSRFCISDDWFNKYLMPEGASNIKRVIINDVCYILELSLETDSVPLVIFNLWGNNAVFTGSQYDVNVFE